ncbi:FHA domain-containing protein, partial [Bordetella bronchiseptica]
MMLTLIVRNPEPGASARRADFHAPGGTLGRDAENCLALPAAPGQLCRVQAALRADAQGWRLHNLSGMAAVHINDAALAPGAVRAIQAGDTLRVGAHTLEVSGPDAPDARPAALPEAAADTPADAPRRGQAGAGAAEDIFSGLFGPGTLPVGGIADAATHPFDLDSAQARNAADPLAHLPAGDAAVSRPAGDPLALFDAPHGGADVFADATPSALPAHDPLAPLRADPVRDTLLPRH